MNEMEGASPSRSSQEANGSTGKLTHAIPPSVPRAIWRLTTVRPVDEERSPFDVVGRDRAPETRVVGEVAIVSETEVTILGDGVFIGLSA